MTKRRKRHSAQFKFGIALEAVKELKTINQIVSEQGVHPNQAEAMAESVDSWSSNANNNQLKLAHWDFGDLTLGHGWTIGQRLVIPGRG